MISDLCNRYPMLDVLVFIGFGLLVLAALPRRGRKHRRIKDDLDTPIFHWNKKDSLTIRDLIAGGIHVFGRTGSGKTSSMKGIAKAIVKYGNSSVLVLCGKKGEAEDWLRCCEETGRSDQVIHFGINEPARFDVISYESTREGEGSGQVGNIVRYIMELRSVIFRRPEGSGGDSEFWRKQEERALTHAVTLLQLAKYEISPEAIHDVIMSAPDKPDFNKDPNWGNTACGRVIGLAYEGADTAIQQHDLLVASDYYLKEWPRMAPETKGSILVGTIGTLTTMNTGLARELFASRSNTNPKEQIEGRKIVIVDFPPDEYGDLGKLAAIGLKWHWQREVLRRRVTKDSPVAVIWGDESSLWVSDTDANYLSRCRSCKGSMVYICQSLDSYREVLPGEKSKSAVEAMLANFSHKLIFALGDSTTATWAADFCGKELKLRGSGGTQFGEMRPFIYERPQYTSSYSEQLDYVIQPAAFLSGFRTGAAPNNFMVDALLIRSGEPFSNGLPIIKVSFDQRG